jgi:hypothetical protein
MPATSPPRASKVTKTVKLSMKMKNPLKINVSKTLGKMKKSVFWHRGTLKNFGPIMHSRPRGVRFRPMAGQSLHHPW